MKKEETVAVSLPRYPLTNKPTVVLTEKLHRQIDYLHSKCPGKEWSGELITHEEGNINDPDNWRIICEEVFLADIGSAGGTDYEVDKGGFKAVDIVELFEAYSGLLEGTQKKQHIHTH